MAILMASSASWACTRPISAAGVPLRRMIRHQGNSAGVRLLGRLDFAGNIGRPSQSLQQPGRPVGLIGEPAEPANAQAQDCAPAPREAQLSPMVPDQWQSASGPAGQPASEFGRAAPISAGSWAKLGPMRRCSSSSLSGNAPAARSLNLVAF
jgi:hypothetical protein